METEVLAQYGIIGLVLLWFMYRLEKILTTQTKAINNQSLVMISVIDVISRCPSTKGSKNGNKIKEEEMEKIKTSILKATT